MNENRQGAAARVAQRPERDGEELVTVRGVGIVSPERRRALARVYGILAGRGRTEREKAGTNDMPINE